MKLIHQASGRPLAQPYALVSDLDRFLGDFFGTTTERPAGLWSPAVDVQETDEAYTVRAEVPGVSPESLDVTVTDKVLTLSGEKSSEKSEEKGGYTRRERTFGRFSRSFTLPKAVDADAIKADYRNGVLELTLPKVKAAQPRRIPVAN